MDYAPHTLVSFQYLEALEETSDWVLQDYLLKEKIWAVVRRAPHRKGWVPVGLRGAMRHQRFGTWILKSDICDVKTPWQWEVDTLKSSFSHHVRGHILAETFLNLVDVFDKYQWGLAGSFGYSYFTQENAIHDLSDLDVLLDAPTYIAPDSFNDIVLWCEQQPCFIDIQMITPLGGVSLKEWVQHTTPQILVKTNEGPKLSRTPWE